MTPREEFIQWLKITGLVVYLGLFIYAIHLLKIIAHAHS